MIQETERQQILELERRTGIVIAICTSFTTSYPKYPQKKVLISKFGIKGDIHAGEFRRSHSNPQILKLNDRAISIVSEEIRQEISEKFGIEISPGNFNENILVSGIGNLSDLRLGDWLYFGTGVILEVTAQNSPCIKLENHLGKSGIIKALIADGKDQRLNFRGVVAKVINPGELIPGATFSVRRRDHSMGG